jgi:hypothetical protein
MGSPWREARTRLLVIGGIGAFFTLVSLLPGSFLCELVGSHSPSCGEVDALELVVSIAVAVIGLGGAVLVGRLADSAP